METTRIEDWQRPGPNRRQRRADLLIGLTVTAVALLNLVLTRSVGMTVAGRSPAVAEQVFWSVAVTLPLVWRRSRPEWTAVVVAVAFIGSQARGTPEYQLSSGAIFTAVYALGAWGADRRRARLLRLGVIAAMFIWLAVAWATSYSDVPGRPPGATGDIPPIVAAIVNGVLINVLIFGFAYLFGETAWLAARRQHQLEVQAEQLRRAQAGERERAVFGERVRIARELHDVVAHHVSVMGIQAAAGRRAMDKDPGAARTALAAVEQGARTAVDELRRMLGALREPSAAASVEAPAQLGIEHIDALVHRVRDAGHTVRYATYGEPAEAPGSVSQAAYRIVQEAVTNTLKHAGASTVDIRLRYLAEELEIDVADDGCGGDSAAGDGMGLVGMRERVAVHEGTLETGPRPDGGFRVRARLPLVLRAGALSEATATR